MPRFSATHALTIRAVLRQGHPLDLPAWIERVSLEGLSVRQLRRQLRAHTRASVEEPALGLIAQEGSVGAQREVIYLRPRRIDLQALRPVDRACLVRDCQRLLERLGAALAGTTPTGEGAAT